MFSHVTLGANDIAATKRFTMLCLVRSASPSVASMSVAG